MEIYILRHGIAEDRRPGRPDAKRALTGDGRRKLQRVLEQAHKARVSPALILTSPYVRAVQTAEMAAEELGCAKPPVHTDALLPSSTPAAVWEEIKAHDGESAILLAGHEPLLSAAASYLLGSRRTIVEFKKGALARIDIEELSGAPHGTLAWLLPPRLAGHRTPSPA